jgi:hypothetical protein
MLWGRHDDGRGAAGAGDIESRIEAAFLSETAELGVSIAAG